MKHIDTLLLVVVVGLVLFGLLMIYDASSVIAFRDYADKFHYIKSQLVWAVFGMILLFVFIHIHYRVLFNLSPLLLVTAIILLIMVFIPGLGVHTLGASRWLNLHFFTIQPTEFVKLVLAIYLAAWFSQKEKGRFTAFALLIGLVLLLVMAQPDMGTAIIILGEAIAIYLLSGGSLKYFSVIVPSLAVLGFILIKLAPYRAARLTSFLAVDTSLTNASYQVKQVLIALGSGGLFGLGLGNSLQKYAYLPENVTDSIFAIIAEELGFFGSVILIAVFGILIWRGLSISSHAKDTFGKLLAGGITMFIGIQVIINLGAMTVLFPLTGVPLPFISYGGSSLLIDLTAIGILLNISRSVEKG